VCFIAESAGFSAPDPAAATLPAEPAPALPRCYRAELIEGRGYRATLEIEATSLLRAGAAAARYAALHGYRLGRVRAGAGGRRGA
jgi:hypothetical protein